MTRLFHLLPFGHFVFPHYYSLGSNGITYCSLGTRVVYQAQSFLSNVRNLKPAFPAVISSRFFICSLDGKALAHNKHAFFFPPDASFFPSAIIELVSDANFECNGTSISLQAMDNLYVPLAAVKSLV